MRGHTLQSRFRFALVTPLVGLSLVLAACGGGDAEPSGAAQPSTSAPSAPSTSDAGFDWRRHAGSSIYVMAGQHPTANAIAPHIAEFEALTGIEVTFEQLPIPEMRNRILVEMVGQSDAIDVYMSSDQNDAALFYQSGWYHPLNEYFEDENQVASDYDFADFSSGLIGNVTFNGDTVSIPILVEMAMLYYRADVFRDAGVAFPPATLDEYEKALAAVYALGRENALGARGRGSAALTQFSGILYNFGGAYIDAQGNAAFDSPEAIEALEYYGRILREYGLRGAVNNSAEESISALQAGQAAVMHDASAFLNNLLDPSISLFADDIAFAPMPAGPRGDFQTTFGWGAAMSAFSKNKDAAWYFIQWWTSPEVVQRSLTEGQVIGGRASTVFGDEIPDDYVAALRVGLTDRARSQLPAVVRVPEAREILGQAIVVAIEGGDVAAAARKANAELQVLIDEDFDAGSLIN